MAVPEAGKRVSWVELYLDLIFVLAVGRLAHVVEDEPRMHGVWIALGLFATLWWTWVGFAVLYNRRGDDEPGLRLLFLAGSVPAGVAAVAVEPASQGHIAAFAIAMAVVRLVLAGAHGIDHGWRSALSRRISRAYFASAGLFLVSIALPGPWRYLLWAVAISSESGALLNEDRKAVDEARRTHSLAALQPVKPGEALDPHHFAERFGLFLIILLGEIVISAGEAPLGAGEGSGGAWLALVASMVLAAALWWLYFDGAADVNLRVLELSGGSPTMARAIFAAGHMIPAFALILTASGLALLLDEDPPRAAFWLASAGIGFYLVGTRVFMAARTHFGGAMRAVLLVATFLLGRLHGIVSPHAYVLILMAWAVMCAALADPADFMRRLSAQ